MQYGIRVSANRVVKKHHESISSTQIRTGWKHSEYKIRNGIYLGKRTLPYGTFKLNGKFNILGRKVVALVSPDGSNNPVYVDPKDLEVSDYV